MIQTAQILDFSTQQSQRKRRLRKHTTSSGFKYFRLNEIQLLRRTVKSRAELAMLKGNKGAVKDWLVIDILTSSGIRASEACDIRISDMRIGYGQNELFVRNGKGGKQRFVQIPGSLKSHLKRFVAWKKQNNEPVGDDDYLLLGQRGQMTRQGIASTVKKYLKMLNLYQPGKAVHSLRHSYAVQLYRAECDIRAVQSQLGHSSLGSTLIYTHVLPDDVQRQIHGLWSGRD